MTPNNILDFWFTETKQEQWFIKDPEFDNLIKNKFFEVHIQATKGELYSWRLTPQGRLAEIIILDQFSRNIYRDDPRAFTFDSTALVLAQEAISQQQDKLLTQKQRWFLYLPFMHSESLAIHIEAVKLFTDLGLSQVLDYEIQHKEIIDRFGRYPHRNNILNRESTLEELEYLKTHSGF